MSSFTEVSLTKAYWTATSINSTGANLASGNTTDAVGNVAGYNYVANQAASTGQQITVNTTHGWNIVGTTAADIIWGGTGNDTFSVLAGGTTGNDTVYGNGGKNVYDYGLAGSTDETVSLADYTYGNDVVVGTVAVNRVGMNKDGVLAVNGNLMQVALASEASQGYYNVTYSDGTTTTNIWFAGTAGSYIDASSETSGLFMNGLTNDSETSSMDTLIGGSGADTIVAGNNDYVYGGAGNDSLRVEGNNTIGLASAGGKDTVVGFQSGLAAEGNSTIWVLDSEIASIGLNYNTTADGENGDLTVTDGSGSLFLGNITNIYDAGGNVGWTELRVTDTTGNTYNVAVGAANLSGVTMKVTDDTYADIFIGGNKTNTTVDFSGVTTDGLLVDLGNTGLDTAHSYYNVYQVNGSTSGDSLIGSSSMANILAGGEGNDSLWGSGSSADTLYGGTSNGATASSGDVFFYGTGDGKDVIADYTSSDAIDLYTGSVTGVSRNTAGNLTITLDSDSTNTLTVVGTAGTAQTADTAYTIDVGGTAYKAEVATDGTTNTLAYSSDVTFYYGGNKTDTLTITDGEDYTISLDGVGGYFSGIEAIDGSSGSGSQVLFGSASGSESLKGGSGTNSLWGGAGAVSDTLIGGSGTTTYGFGTGEGNDVITSSTSSDTVLLYDVSLSDISSCGVTSGAMVITLTDGSSLKIKNYTSSSVNTFTLSDGTSYTYDYSTKGWSVKS